MGASPAHTRTLHRPLSPRSRRRRPHRRCGRGDEIIIDIPNRTLTLCVPDEEIKRRLRAVKHIHKPATPGLALRGAGDQCRSRRGAEAPGRGRVRNSEEEDTGKRAAGVDLFLVLSQCPSGIDYEGTSATSLKQNRESKGRPLWPPPFNFDLVRGTEAGETICSIFQRRCDDDPDLSACAVAGIVIPACQSVVLGN